MSVLSILPWLISIVGAYLLIKLRCFFIFHPGRTLSAALHGSTKDLRALALALAGTLGVGNIIGVSVGIAAGGAGAVFWLLISSVFSSVIKYAEVALSVDGARGGGFIGVIKGSFCRLGAPLASAFALLCLLLAFFMGGALQCSAIADVARDSFGISSYIIPIPLILSVGFLTLGGGEKIEKWVSFIIPIATIVYIFMCFAVIIPNISRLPQVIRDIFSGAFSTKSTGGGILGFLVSKPLSEGYARGILSNEAGAGTSSFAHIRSAERTPHAAGVFGIIEVVFDTVILCGITALTVLLAIPEAELSSGELLIAEALSQGLGGFGGIGLFICVLLFALATVICWYYYGSVCYKYLFGKRFGWFYFPLFLIFCGIGALFSSKPIIFITDILLFSLSIIATMTLLKNRQRIKGIYLADMR